MSLLSVINESFIGKKVRVQSIDGRIFEGTLIAKEGAEIILKDASFKYTSEACVLSYDIESELIYLTTNSMEIINEEV